jgi:hypothetical protein
VLHLQERRKFISGRRAHLVTLFSCVAAIPGHCIYVGGILIFLGGICLQSSCVCRRTDRRE